MPAHLRVEVAEQYEEDQRARKDPIVEHFRIGAIAQRQRVHGMEDHSDELQYLSRGHVSVRKRGNRYGEISRNQRGTIPSGRREF